LISDGTRWITANAVSRGIGVIPVPKTNGNILVDTGSSWISTSSNGLLVAPGTANNIMISNGTTWTSSPSTNILPTPSTVGNVMTSDGTKWNSSLNPTIGVGQSWSNVLSNRALGTAYTNTTSKPIMVSLSGAGFTAPVPPAVVAAPSTISLSINGVVVSKTDANNTVQGIVPAGSAYIATTTGTVTLVNWAELR
jgi:hypothetical protein